MFKSRLAKGGAIATLLIGLVGGFEGLRTTAYKDPVGVPTICYGETLGVKLGDVKSTEECRELLSTRLVEFESRMASCLTEPDRIPDKSYIAFISFTYNVGPGNFCRSTLVRLANAGDITGACNELPKWVYAGGERLRGLERRRAEEKALCLEGVREGAPKDVPGTVSFWWFLLVPVVVVPAVFTIFGRTKNASKSTASSAKSVEDDSVGKHDQDSSGV